jgi:hypothetical protein
MMASNVATKDETQVARPLNVLIPLIKEALGAAKMAADEAAKPYFVCVAELLVEARSQQTYSECLSWAFRHFKIREVQVKRYLSLGNHLRIKGRAATFESLNDYTRQQGSQVGGQAAWREPIKKIMGKVDLEGLRQADLSRIQERALEKELALQLIDIGYKALATKLHPDKGGSRDAMARLNTVRERLKAHA